MTTADDDGDDYQTVDGPSMQLPSSVCSLVWHRWQRKRREKKPNGRSVDYLLRRVLDFASIPTRLADDVLCASTVDEQRKKIRSVRGRPIRSPDFNGSRGHELITNTLDKQLKRKKRRRRVCGRKFIANQLYDLLPCGPCSRVVCAQLHAHI